MDLQYNDYILNDSLNQVNVTIYALGESTLANLGSSNNLVNLKFYLNPQGGDYSYLHNKTTELTFLGEFIIGDTEINEITWYFSTENKMDFSKEYFFMRMYYPSKMNQLLIDAEFKILHQWGDYYRSNLGAGSKLQIYDTQLA